MSNEIRLPVVGRLTAAPELKFTPSGAAVVNFTVASNARTFDRQENAFKDQPATFLRCTAWRDLAENIAESLDKGDEVVLIGELVQREYETREGEKRTVMEVKVEAIGPSLRWSTAKPIKGDRVGVRTGAPSRQAPTDDPWATPGGQGGYPNDEPPF